MNGLVAMAMVGLTGCANIAATTYELGSGDANYDALNAATKTCEAVGGAVKLKSGYDNRQLSSYLCVGGKAN